MPTTKYKRLTLKIDGYTPHTLPMARLAEYIRDLAALLGADSDAHFVKVGDGSAALVHDVPEPQYVAVKSRVMAAERGEGPTEAVRGYRELRAKLQHDGKPAKFISEGGAKIIEFPLQPPPAFGAITQSGSLEGVLIKLGGRDETVPVHLQDGERYYKCVTTRELARQLAPRLFGTPLRVNGTGRWVRGEDGAWTLEQFRIASWEQLNDDALEAVLARMRVAESDWDKVHDPLGELRRLRKGNGKAQ